MTEPSGEIAFVCDVGLPGSTTASPSCPNQAAQAAMTVAVSSALVGMPPSPWYVSRKFAIVMTSTSAVSPMPPVASPSGARS